MNKITKFFREIIYKLSSIFYQKDILYPENVDKIITNNDYFNIIFREIIYKLSSIFYQKDLLNPTKVDKIIKNNDYLYVIDQFHKGNLLPRFIYFYSIGYCYFKIQQYKKAILYLNKSLSIPFDFFRKILCLALSYGELGIYKKSYYYLRICLRNQFLGNFYSLNTISEILDQIASISIDEQINSKLINSIKKKKIKNFSLIKEKIFFYCSNTTEKDIYKENKIYQISSIEKLYNEKGISIIKLPKQTQLYYFDIYQNKNHLNIDLPQPYICSIKSARILSGSSLVLYKQFVISENLSNKKYGRYCDLRFDPVVIAHKRKHLLIKEFKKGKRVSKGFMLCGQASSAYGHWTQEYLPKLRFLEQYPNFSSIPIIVDANMPSTHYEFLKAILDNPILTLKKNEYLDIDELLVAPSDTFFPTHLKCSNSIPQEQLSSFTIDALKYIKEKINSKFDCPSREPKSRIFLSRRNSTWRKVTNENEVYNYLKKFNFEKIYIEDFDFYKQVSIFRNAKYIVAPNGSALNNLIFSNDTSKILILGQQNTFNLGGWYGSFLKLGFNLDYFSSEINIEEPFKHSNYEINMELFKIKINKYFKL